MIVVTGGAGFIGSAFAWKLNREGVKDVLIVDHLGTTDKWKNLVGLHYVDFVPKDEFLKMLLEGHPPAQVEAIIHMGACSATTERDADYLMENNYAYSCVLAEWAIENDVRFIYASSAATYGDGSLGFSDDDALTEKLRPLNMYGYSKQLLDLWAIRRDMMDKIAGLRFFNVFGPNEYHKGDMSSVIFKAFHQIKETGRIRLFKSYRPEYGDGEQVRDFVYIKDVVEVMWQLLKRPEVNGIFNLGTGKARSWNDLARAVFAAMNLPPNIDYIEMPETLRDRYQYRTEAVMDKIAGKGIELKFRPLEEAICDYVVNHLERPWSSLETGR
ncbi:MAG: ADP-glyceromanno-heptose 6-epimerase [Candidatus Sumerlaeota bacterium]|nr:ADP-glyceromanno-heptose 6-epimerase [Candidatus Sumerlaeota bacterium]